MKKITLLLLAIIIGLPMTAIADSNINLTPVPMKMTVGSGKLVLPESFTIATIGIDDEMAAEAKKFSKLFAEISGYSVSVANEGDALITMSRYTGNEELGNGVHYGTRSILAQKGVPLGDHRSTKFLKSDVWVNACFL